MPGPISDAAMALAKQAGQEAPLPNVGVPPSQHESKWPYAALALGQLADAWTTLEATKGGQFKESNPMGVGGTMAAKAAVGTAIALLMHHEAQTGHDKAAKVLGVMGGLAGGIPAVWNLSQIAKEQP